MHGTATKGRVRSKRCADPQYAKGTGAKHGAGGRQRGVSGTAQGTGRNFIQIAERFKKQNTQYAHTGFADHGFFAGKQAGKEAAEHHNGDNEPKAAQGGKEQAKPKKFSAAMQLAGGVVLALKCGGGLPKGRDGVVGKILKIHGNGAAGNGHRAKPIDGCLHKNIGKAENRSLHRRGNAGFQNCGNIAPLGVRMTQRQMKKRILLQPPQNQSGRK